MRVLSKLKSSSASNRFEVVLDLEAKKKEFEALFVEIRRDATSVGGGGGMKDEISGEIIESLMRWMSEIWQVVVEGGVWFEKAHRCLMLASEVLHRVMHTGLGCVLLPL